MKVASGLHKDADSPLVFIPNVEKLQKSLQKKNEQQAKNDINDLSQAIELEPENLTYLYMRFLRYQFLDQKQNGLADNKTLVKLDPENPKWYLHLAFSNFAENNYQETIDAIDTYLKMSGSFGDEGLFFIDGVSNLALGNLQNAITAFSKGLAIKETDILYYYRGLANYKLHHPVKSYYDFKKALAINPQIEADDDNKIPKSIKLFMNKITTGSTPIGLSRMKIKE